MKTIFLLSSAFLAASCQDPRAEQIDRIEGKFGGWNAIEFTINRTGDGTFVSYPLNPPPKTTPFKVLPAAFEAFERRLSKYRDEAVPVTEKSIRANMDFVCPPGVPNVTDQGFAHIIWVGRNVKKHFLADFGCDHIRYKARNDDLREIVASLPLPKD